MSYCDHFLIHTSFHFLLYLDHAEKKNNISSINLKYYNKIGTLNLDLV